MDGPSGRDAGEPPKEFITKAAARIWSWSFYFMLVLLVLALIVTALTR